LETGKVILGDMGAIREKGVEYLNNNFFWPIPEDEFRAFYRYTQNCYVDLMLKLEDTPAYDIALIDLSLVSYLIQVFHYNYLKQYAIENNIKLITSKESQHYMYPDWSKVESFYSDQDYPFSKIKRYFRRGIKNLLFNRHLPILHIIAGILPNKNKVIGLGSNDSIKNEFIIKNEIFCDHREWIDIIPTGLSQDKRVLDTVEYVYDSVISMFLKEISSCDSLFVKNMEFDIIGKVWKQRIHELSTLYCGLYNKVWDFEKILVTESAKPFHKLIMLALHRKGYDVYGFHHGDDASFVRCEMEHQVTVSHCNKFVVTTKGISNKYVNDYSNLLIEKRTGTQYINLNNGYLLRKFYWNKKLANKNNHVKNIMIMGYPVNSDRYFTEHALFFYAQIDLEYRLIQLLSENGFNVIFKAHPDRLNEVRGLFEEYVDDFVSDKFENTWMCADMLLFTYSSTSTFAYGLSTNLPIVLLDTSSELRDEGDLIKINQRVKIVDSTVSKQCRIEFNEVELLEAIMNNKSYLDDEYIKYYYGEV